MSGNLENDRSVTAGKMYPIDLAQKITIVKSVSNTEVKMAHLIPGQPKPAGPGQLITHTGAVMRPATIISPNDSSQPQMIVSGSPLLQGTQIVSQGTQLLGPNSQIISQSQIIGPSGQLLSPGTQIISQGTQLSAQVSNANTGSNSVSVASTVNQVLSMGLSNTQGLVSGAGNLVVSSSVRTLPPSVRVLPPLTHHSNRPVHVNVSSGSGVLVSKGVTSHVPRGLAAGASLAIRPVAPASSPAGHGPWSSQARGRGVVYGGRAAPRPAARPPPPAPAPAPHSAIVTLPTTTVLTSSGVISSTVRALAPAAPRPLPLLQRNYPPKVVGPGSAGNVRGAVGNSAPTQLYYEVPRAVAAPPPRSPLQLAPAPSGVQVQGLAPRALSYAHAQTHTLPHQVSVVSSAQLPPAPAPAPAPAAQPRPTILRKRESESSPTKPPPPSPPYGGAWEAAEGSGGSTTVSAASSPAAASPPPSPPRRHRRKKPRKQLMSTEVRQCTEYHQEEPPPTPPVHPPPKRPQLSSTYVCGWRSTALHFQRPSDVRRREPRPKDILQLASQRHVLAAADGWKLHHLTAQLDDLVSLEADVGAQLNGMLKTLEGAGSRVLGALQPHTHNLSELVKGNIQRSKIVCEGVQEAREDILRVFTHRTFVSDILTRQADKRCFRKHRSQS